MQEALPLKVLIVAVLLVCRDHGRMVRVKWAVFAFAST